MSTCEQRSRCRLVAVKSSLWMKGLMRPMLVREGMSMTQYSPFKHAVQSDVVRMLKRFVASIGRSGDCC